MEDPQNEHDMARKQQLSNNAQVRLKKKINPSLLRVGSKLDSNLSYTWYRAIHEKACKKPIGPRPKRPIPNIIHATRVSLIPSPSSKKCKETNRYGYICTLKKKKHAMLVNSLGKVFQIYACCP